MIKIKIPPHIEQIMQTLRRGGYEVYLVGGCVRDALLGVDISDYDLTTDATPQQMLCCLSSYRVIETGIKHGTLTVVTPHGCAEVTTYRVDGEYDDHRHPSEVCFTKSLREDLSRRDFTVNAMAYSEEDGYIDPFGGMADLEKGLVRCVGEAEVRFSEDSLRILRALRFSAVLGFDIDKATKDGARKKRELLRSISSERIYSELVKLLCGKNAGSVLLDFSEIICTVLPELAPAVGFEQHNPYHCYDVYTHTAYAIQSSHADPAVRLALLFHDAGKPACFTRDERGGHFYGHAATGAELARRALLRLRADGDMLNTVTSLVAWHDTVFSPNEKQLKRLLCKFGESFVRRLLYVHMGDVSAQAPQLRGQRTANAAECEALLDEIIAAQSCFCLRDLAVNGDDLLQIGYQPGRRLGMTLRQLLSDVIEGKEPNEKERLLHLAEQRLRDRYETDA